jgi:hypothetical protein
VSWRAGAEKLFGEPLPDAPWPVAAKNLLTERERSLYQRLLSLYPEHKIFVQVALSQLIDVPESHPERISVRNRFSQLVADFVLCRSDLSVIAIIELDDPSHKRADRQYADARKNKALADAGLRLIRIPAGTLPSEDDLRKLIDAHGAVEEGVQEETVLSLLEPVETYEEAPIHAWRDNSSAESRELKQVVLKAVALVVLLLGGWLIFSQLLPAAIKVAFQPLAVPRVHAPLIPTRPVAVMPTAIPASPVVAGPTAAALAAQRQQAFQVANALQKKKDLAWEAFYTPPAFCEHPVDWTAQVECGNLYMRAKKRFEEQWETSQRTGAGVVLDSGSPRAVRR